MSVHLRRNRDCDDSHSTRICLRLVSLKNSSQAKQEAARLEVENAEDDLVQKTEVAITLMKTVLENVRAQMFIPLFPV